VYIPANPLDALTAAFRAGGWELETHIAIAIVLADQDQDFASKVLGSRTYWSLIGAGIPGDILLEICTRFHALERLREWRLNHFKQKRKLQRGRPCDFYPLFQVLCSSLATRYGHGRQFREEFCTLVELVFGKFVAVDSYRTTLKRARREFSRPAVSSVRCG
jgi:hypothetical protein